MESERRKNNCYLVFGDKNDVFLFFKNVEYLTRLTFAQEGHALLKELGLLSNRANFWL